MPISRPNCVSLNPSSALILMPMIEKIVHTAKQTVKAMVDMVSARCRWLVGEELGSLILCSMGGVGGAALWLKTKKLPARPLASVHPGSRKT